MKKLNIIGLSLGAAAQALNDAGYSYRIVSRNGVPSVAPRNYDPSRVNLTLVNGTVITYDFG